MNMDATVANASVEKIAATMKQMDRPNLLRMLGLNFDRKIVTDAEGLHPVTLYQKSTLSIDSWKVGANLYAIR